MSEVKIKYRLSRLLPFYRTREFSHPDAWSELSHQQFIVAASILNGTMTDDRVIKFMTNLPGRIIRRLSSYQKLRILELLMFLNDFSPYHKFTIESIGDLRAPEEKLRNEPFGAFIFAETYFARYEKSYELADLDKFIACLYRDRPFNEKYIQLNAHEIGKAPELTRQAVYVNYKLIREFLALNYPNVFAPSSDPDQSNDSSWVDVFDAVVGDDIVKQADYAKLEVSTVLRFLDKSIAKNRKK